LLILAGIIPLIGLFHPGLFVGHDVHLQVARIASFYKSLSEGIIVPRWGGELNLGYGHPALMFYYPLTSYVAALFHFIGFPLVFSAKLVYALGFIGSGVAMYYWIKELWGDKAGFISGVLYMYAPYRFVDLYVRGSIGENFFFIWPPLLLYFLTKSSKKQNWIYLTGGSMSLAALILSHNALSIMFLPFIGIYGLLLVLAAKRKLLVFTHQLLVLGSGFGLTAFFWIPALVESKYTLQNVIMGDGIYKNFMNFSQLLGSKVGALQWTIMLVLILVLFLWKLGKIKLKITNYDLRIVILAIVFFIFALFMILSISRPIYETFTILKQFQFPWRWLSLAIFLSAIIAGFLSKLIPRANSNIAIYALLAASIFLTRNMWNIENYTNNSDEYYINYQGSTDASGETSPIWSVRFMEVKPNAHLEVIDGKAEIAEVSRESVIHQYNVTVVSERVRLLENTLYFPGWNVYIDGNKLALDDLSWQDRDHHGLMTFYVPEGEHEIIVKLERTKVRMLAEIISLISIGLLVSLPILSKVLWSKK